MRREKEKKNQREIYNMHFFNTESLEWSRNFLHEANFNNSSNKFKVTSKTNVGIITNMFGLDVAFWKHYACEGVRK